MACEIRCASCGRFISNAEMASGAARFNFTPSNHFGPEISEWECAACLRPSPTETVSDRLKRGSKEGENDCRNWISARAGHYGAVQINGIKYRAHRLAWINAHGAVPPGFHVLHKCDNPRCINLDHLWLGTDADNHADKKQKGRALRGEQIRQARLNAEQVLEIRKSAPTIKKMAARYGVSRETIRKIRNRLTWRHI